MALHNLANVNTTGFRGEQTTFESLLALASSTAPNLLNLATNNYGVLEGAHLDLTPAFWPAPGTRSTWESRATASSLYRPRAARAIRAMAALGPSTGEWVTVAGDPVRRQCRTTRRDSCSGRCGHDSRMEHCQSAA